MRPWTLLVILLAAMGCGRLAAHRIQGSGSVEADEIQVAPLYPGRIAYLHVREGDSFKQGDVLVTLTNGEMDADVAFSRAGLDGARRNVTQAQVNHDNALRERKRAEELFRAGSVSQQDLDRAATREQVAASQHQAAKAQADQLEAAVSRSSYRYKETRLVAPVGGIVLRRNFEIGEVVMPGSPILSVANLERVHMNIYVAAPDLARVRHGQDASVSIDGIDQSYPAKVIYIASQAEFTPKNVQTKDARSRLVFQVRLAITNREGILKPGMPGEAYISGEQNEPAKK